MASSPDPKPARRVKDPALLKHLHLIWTRCALEDDTCEYRLSLHHISKHPRDDVRGNLVALCGSGTTGHHGRIEARDPVTRSALGRSLAARSETVSYLIDRFGSPMAARNFLNREYPA